MISSATIRAGAARRLPAFWEAAAVRSFKDIAVTCACRWEMTFERGRVSGWALAETLPRCPHHGEAAR